MSVNVLFLNKIERAIAGFIQGIGWLASGLLIILVALISMNVFMRYALNDVSIGLQELEWHLFASLFLLGISYAWVHDGHVRVDVLYDRFKPKTQLLVNLLGTWLFLIPLALLIVWYGWDYTIYSFKLGEKSGDPGGLAYRWLIKAMIPLSSLLLVMAACLVSARHIRQLIQLKSTHQ